jgi:glutamyl-tRNA synthetase
MPRGRFAPSPTGDLHLGGARTALCAWLAARRDRGAFLVRMEDLDRPRVVPGAAARILDDLAWLGLDWDGEVTVQSARTDRYDQALDRLRAAGHVFPCWCSRADIARAATAPHGPGDEGPRYPGTCRELTEEQKHQFSASDRRPSLRLRVPAGEVEWVDQVAGPQRQDVLATVGDFVLRRADGVHAYQLAVVVDDVAGGIEEVVRGDDLLSSTPRQVLLYRLLGAPAPRWAHVPLILGPDGKRLSKRHGSVAVRQLREAGLDAPRLLGQLAASLHLCSAGARVTPGELLPGFDPARLPHAPTVLDPADLLKL